MSKLKMVYVRHYDPTLLETTESSVRINVHLALEAPIRIVQQKLTLTGRAMDMI